MRFYIYHRPLLSIQKKEFIGTLIHVSCKLGEYSPDGESWKVYRCNRSESSYKRLNKMLVSNGMIGDDIHPLTCKRTVKDLIEYMNTWRD